MEGEGEHRAVGLEALDQTHDGGRLAGGSVELAAPYREDEDAEDPDRDARPARLEPAWRREREGEHEHDDVEAEVEEADVLGEADCGGGRDGEAEEGEHGQPVGEAPLRIGLRRGLLPAGAPHDGRENHDREADQDLRVARQRTEHGGDDEALLGLERAPLDPEGIDDAVQEPRARDVREERVRGEAARARALRACARARG